MSGSQQVLALVLARGDTDEHLVERLGEAVLSSYRDCCMNDSKQGFSVWIQGCMMMVQKVEEWLLQRRIPERCVHAYRIDDDLFGCAPRALLRRMQKNGVSGGDMMVNIISLRPYDAGIERCLLREILSEPGRMPRITIHGHTSRWSIFLGTLVFLWRKMRRMKMGPWFSQRSLVK